MSKLFVSLFFVTLVSSFSLSAKEVILSVTDNDDNNEIYNLIVNVDESTDNLVELYKDTYIDGTKIKRDVLDSEDLKTDHGMILEKRDNYNVLNLKSQNFDVVRGGSITIDTLYNGIKGERRNYELELAKDATGWKLFKKDKIVSKFHVKVNKIIIVGAVGIKTIIME
jgi:hypothetical protein